MSVCAKVICSLMYMDDVYMACCYSFFAGPLAVLKCWSRQSWRSTCWGSLGEWQWWDHMNSFGDTVRESMKFGTCSEERPNISVEGCWGCAARQEVQRGYMGVVRGHEGCWCERKGGKELDGGRLFSADNWKAKAQRKMNKQVKLAFVFVSAFQNISKNNLVYIFSTPVV